MMRYCRDELGASDLKFGRRLGLSGDDDLKDGQFSELPIFLNKGFMALGSLSLAKKKDNSFRRSIQVWRNDDLKKLELGYKEQHARDLPVITLDKIMCTVTDKKAPFSAFVDVAIIRNGTDLISSESIGFVYKKRTKGIVYLERGESYIRSSSFAFDNIFTELRDHEFLIVRLTLRIGPSTFEDFEFNLTQYANSFYIKTISYVDFFKRDYVLVMKSLKLHECSIYDNFTEVFENKNIYIDDFYSSRTVFPNFSPSILKQLDQSLLEGEAAGYLFDDEIVPDGYLNHFYCFLFERMRYDTIEDNFIKAKIPEIYWETFVDRLLAETRLLEELRVYGYVEVSQSIEIISKMLARDDAEQLSLLITVASFGVKREYRGRFWASLASRNGLYKINAKLDEVAPVFVDQLYISSSAPNNFGLKCLFRNHQRIVTHIMSILITTCLGHEYNIPMLAQEVKMMVLSFHEFFSREDFTKTIKAILLVCSMLYELPNNKDQEIGYFLRKSQREISFLKIIMAQIIPNVLKKIFDLGLSVEALFSNALNFSFSNFFQFELALRIRDIGFILIFFPEKKSADFDYFLFFKCAIICAMIVPHTSLFLSIKDAEDLSTSIKVIASSQSDFQKLIIDAFYIMNSIIQAHGVGDDIFRHVRLDGIERTTEIFNMICRITQEKGEDEEEMNFKQEAFIPLLRFAKEVLSSAAKKHSEDQVPQLYFSSHHEENREIFDEFPQLPSPSTSNTLILNEHLRPQQLKRSTSENTISIYIHQLGDSGQGSLSKHLHLYFLFGEAVQFTTKIGPDGHADIAFFELFPPDKMESINIELRREEHVLEDDENRVVNVDHFKGRIELRRFRLGVVEKIRTPLRYYHIGEQNGALEQIEIDFTLLLNFIQQISLEDFEEYVTPQEQLIQIDNYWGIKKVWKIPDFVEQNSLISAADYLDFSNKFLERHNENRSLMFLDKYLAMRYEMIPVCRGFIIGIFYAGFGLAEKINLIWDTLIFFENLKEDYFSNDGCLETDTVCFFMRTISRICWPSLPYHSVENIVDLNFAGRIPSIRAAWFIGSSYILNITEYFQSVLNHVHFTTGQRELDFSNVNLLNSIAQYVVNQGASLNPFLGKVHLELFNNRGVSYHSFNLATRPRPPTIELALHEKELRLLVENQRVRITRERFEVQVPNIGLFSHLHQSDSFFSGDDPFNVNAYALVNSEWFEAVVLNTEAEIAKLYDEFPEWDRTLFDANLNKDEHLCFLRISPIDLFRIKRTYLIFL